MKRFKISGLTFCCPKLLLDAVFQCHDYNFTFWGYSFDHIAHMQ